MVPERDGASGGRWLGVDPGTVRVGIAISDPEGRLAVPLEIVPARAAFPAIRAIATREAVSGIVVGLPLLMDGPEGAAARAARKLGARVERDGRWPVVYVDERLTSREAARYGDGPADDAAATILLQAFLDGRRAAEAQRDVARLDGERAPRDDGGGSR